MVPKNSAVWTIVVRDANNPLRPWHSYGICVIEDPVHQMDCFGLNICIHVRSPEEP